MSALAAPAPYAFAPSPCGGLRTGLNGTAVTLRPSGALWIEAARMLVVADLLARMTPTDQELKLGVFTALIGAPLFALIAWRAAREWRI